MRVTALADQASILFDGRRLVPGHPSSFGSTGRFSRRVISPCPSFAPGLGLASRKLRNSLRPTHAILCSCRADSSIHFAHVVNEVLVCRDRHGGIDKVRCQWNQRLLAVLLHAHGYLRDGMVMGRGSDSRSQPSLLAGSIGSQRIACRRAFQSPGQDRGDRAETIGKRQIYLRRSERQFFNCS